MSSAVAVNSSCDVPLKVTHLNNLFAIFRYPTSMSVGEVVEIETTFKIHLIRNQYFQFLLKKTSEQTISVIFERHFEDQTSEAGSMGEDEVEADDGCFHRLYISVLGVMEKPKSAVLRSTDAKVSVEFMEDSFLNPRLPVEFINTIKCVIRRIEVKDVLMLHESVENVCESERRKMASVTKLAKQGGVLTGQRTCFTNKVTKIIRRACHYLEELAQYFEAKGSANPKPPTIDLGLVLGYLWNGDRVSITIKECRKFYLLAVREGLRFAKELCTAFIVENLDGDECVIEVLRLAVVTEEAGLFDVALRHFLKNKLEIFNSESWKSLAREKAFVARSIVHGSLLRCVTDNSGFPPAIEDESGEP